MDRIDDNNEIKSHFGDMVKKRSRLQWPPLGLSAVNTPKTERHPRSVHGIVLSVLKDCTQSKRKLSDYVRREAQCL
jgi:hypothetical protein